MKCNKCGRPLKKDDEFCMGCGTRVISENENIEKKRIVASKPIKKLAIATGNLKI